MLKDQLEYCRKTKKTLINKRKGDLSFIKDTDMDTNNILEHFTYDSKYTKRSALHFDRDSLTAIEESKFNLKFTKFLKKLIKDMNTENIEYILEFLNRVYSIESYNSRELTFLLLPFKKFSEQFLLHSKNTMNEFKDLPAYSLQAITKIMVRKREIFNFLIEYYKNYEHINVFLDQITSYVIDIIKCSNFDYLSEFYQILKILIDKGHNDKALHIYNRLKEYLACEEFKILMDSIVEDEGKEDNTISKNKVIANIKKYSIDSVNENISHLIKPSKSNTFYNEINNTFTCNSDNLSDKNKINLLLNDEEIGKLAYNFNINFLTEKNQKLFINNMTKDDLKKYFNIIYRKCFTFPTFSAELFNERISFETLISIVFEIEVFSDSFLSEIFLDACFSKVLKSNILKLANYKKYNMKDILCQSDFNEGLVINYFLKSNDYLETDTLIKIERSIIENKYFEFVHQFCNILSTRANNYNILEFLQFIIIHKLFNEAEEMILSRYPDVSTEILYLFCVELNSPRFIEILLLKKNDFVESLYKDNKIDLIIEVYKMNGIMSVVFNHQIFYSIVLEKYFEAKDDKVLDVVEFLIQNYTEKASFVNILDNIRLLIHLRTSPSWTIAKTILLDCLIDKNDFRYVFEFTINNLFLFSKDDQLLFELLIINHEDENLNLKIISGFGETSAIFIDQYLRYRKPSYIQYLPSIVPVLIEHVKPSIIDVLKNHQKLMKPYYKKILEVYQDYYDLLVKLDIDFFIQALGIDVFQFESFLFTIFKKGQCSDILTIDILAKNISDSDNLISDMMVSEFIEFFGRSFSGSYSKEVDILMGKIQERNASLFEKLKDSYFKSNP